MRRVLISMFLFAAMLLLEACAALPNHGPQAIDISLGSMIEGSSPLPYLVVPLDPITISKSNHHQPSLFLNEFRDAFGGTRVLSVGAGDQLTINIWEPSPDGVFATAENKQTSLTAIVDEDGMIYIPYAGRVKASGHRVEDLRQAIERALHGKAVEPQVQVVLEENASNKVVLVGDLVRPGQFPVPIRGLRLMEAIAQAGGTKAPVYEAVATISRGRQHGTMRLDAVNSIPENNIWLAPADTIVVQHQPRSYSAFGSVQQTGLMAFQSETITMMEALAAVKGLRNESADAAGVFLFRFEDEGLAKDLAELPAARGAGHEAVAGAIPVVYRLDLSNPDALFLAQKFMMKDKDVLYVASHPTAELGKFLSTIVSPLVGSARMAASIGE